MYVCVCVCARARTCPNQMMHSSVGTVIDLFTCLFPTSLRALRGRRVVIFYVLFLFASLPPNAQRTHSANVWVVCTVNKLTKCYPFSSSVRLFPHTSIFKSSQNKTSQTRKSNQEERKQRHPFLGPLFISLCPSLPFSSPTVLLSFQESLLRNSRGAS